MASRVCVGGGSMGARAALDGRRAGDRTLVIDIDEHCLGREIADRVIDDVGPFLGAPPGSVSLLVSDGVTSLRELLTLCVPEVVVPAAQGHLAARLAVEHVRAHGRELRPAPDLVPMLLDALPKEYVLHGDGANGVVITSFMPLSQRCLEGCAQPPLCPVTGDANPLPMCAMVSTALRDHVEASIVLIAQDRHGIGCLHGHDLVEMLRSLDSMEGGVTVGVATACGCHGFINLLRMSDERGNGVRPSPQVSLR